MGRGLLIIVSGLLIIYGMIQHAMNGRQNAITQQNVTYAVQTKSETIANSMADMAIAEVNKFPTNRTAGEFLERDMLGGNGSVSINFELPFAPQNPFIEYKVIQATGIFDGDTSRVEVKTQRRAFSKYAYFSMKEDKGIAFVSKNVFEGPVHTNDRFYIDGDPEFNGPVTSTKDWLGRDGGSQSGNNPKFNDGSDFESPFIEMPADASSVSDEAEAGGLRFKNYDKIKVEFKDDGTATISKYQQNGEKDECKYIETKKSGKQKCWGGTHKVPTYALASTETKNLSDSDFNGLISTANKMEVIGTLDGDVTVHSDTEIKITGDVRYKDDPRIKQDSDDFLGIVSEGQVIVDKYAQKADGERDVDIHASVMAMDNDDTDAEEKFYVEEARLGKEPRGFINLLGGLIQYKRGIVGMGANKGGLSKNYAYDKRFLGRSPRGFPRSDVFDYISWKLLHKNEKFSN